MMVPIQVIRWYRMQCYDGTDSCAIVVPIRRYCQNKIINYILSDVQDWAITKDDAVVLKADVDKIKDDINTLYELNDELVTDRNIDD